MTPKQAENIIDNILSGDKSSKYYIHRTAIGPVFYDVSNGKIYTNKEYHAMSISRDEGYEFVGETDIFYDNNEHYDCDKDELELETLKMQKKINNE